MQQESLAMRRRVAMREGVQVEVDVGVGVLTPLGAVEGEAVA